MGGIGKSVLAAALVRDDAVRDAFPDGVMWVTLLGFVLPDAASHTATLMPTPCRRRSSPDLLCRLNVLDLTEAHVVA
jgi:hypothetical protein